MDNYIVSARKYRPTAFDAVVGQHALTTTLKNAIATGKLAHAYLFCGPRGVGKTTCARIFAKTINCLQPQANGEACDACESCVAFNEGRSYNIHELDAASNNSVEDIRSLIEQVMMPPQVGRYKVFIIDEVHMLSQAAFNAFLKTLEEPPAHAIFILATTEKHKILPTILSRCQIYDFNRMEVADIVNHLKHVADREGISYEEEALAVIAHKADGGMRDAMSIFDRVTSYSDGNITYKKVIEDLNVLDYDCYFAMTDALLKPDIPAAMVQLNDILSKGFEGSHFIAGLASHFRDLLVSRDEQTLPLLEVAESVRGRYREQAVRCEPRFIYRALKLCNNCDINYRTGSNKRLLVELTLIEVAQSVDGAEGCGLGPTKKLKPLFNTTQAAPAPVAAAPAAGAAAPGVAAQASAPSTSQVATVSPLPAASVASEPQAGYRPRGIKTISIRTSPETAASQPVSATAQADMAKTGEVREFEQSDLSYQWYRYACALPKEHKATAGRMKNIDPRLKDGWVVEVPVESEMVVGYMEEFRSSLTAYLRRQLHNDEISLSFVIAPSQEAAKVYSRRELLELMLKENTAFSALAKDLDLELA